MRGHAVLPLVLPGVSMYSEQEDRYNVCNVSLVCGISLAPGCLLKHVNYHETANYNSSLMVYNSTI